MAFQNNILGEPVNGGVGEEVFFTQLLTRISSVFGLPRHALSLLCHSPFTLAHI